MSDSKTILINSIKEWVSLNNQINEIQKTMKELKNKKKQLSTTLINVMENNEIDRFDINDGKLVYKKTKVKAAISSRAKARYIKDKIETQAYTDAVSRDIVEAGDSTAIGRMGEYVVMEALEDLGFKVKLLNGIDPCDLLIKVGQQWKRVEVKTSKVGLQSKALKDGTRNKMFMFNAIKTQLFDMLVLVFVDYDKTVIKVGGKEAKKFVNLRGSNGKNGRNLFFYKDSYRHPKEFGQEIFTEINKKNVKLALK